MERPEQLSLVRQYTYGFLFRVHNNDKCLHNSTTHRASTSMYWLTFRVRVVAIATQPVHRLQIRPIVHN